MKYIGHYKDIDRLLWYLLKKEVMLEVEGKVTHAVMYRDSACNRLFDGVRRRVHSIVLAEIEEWVEDLL